MAEKSKLQEKYFGAKKPESKGDKMPDNLKGESHEYDHRRPKKPVQSRYKQV